MLKLRTRDYLKSNEKLRVQMVKVMQSLKTCRPSDPLGHVASILRGESPAAEARSTARVDLVWGGNVGVLLTFRLFRCTAHAILLLHSSASVSGPAHLSNTTHKRYEHTARRAVPFMYGVLGLLLYSPDPKLNTI